MYYLEKFLQIFFVVTSALFIPIVISKYQKLKISQRYKFIVGFTEYSGWILCYTFVYGLALALLYCLFDSCTGNATIVWIIPFGYFFTALPLGAILSFFGWRFRKNIEAEKSEQQQ